MYSGPIVLAGMFAEYAQLEYLQQVEAIKKIDRTNISAIDGRQYMKLLPECASNLHDTVGTCVTERKHKRYRNGHQCTGRSGGYRDLISSKNFIVFTSMLRHTSSRWSGCFL